MSYFRVQTADRDVNDLLDPEFQHSHHWNNIESERYVQTGISVCETIEDLAAYLAVSGIPIGNGDEWVLVEIDGYESDDQPYDADSGELLVHPTEIIGVYEMTDEFYEMISDAYDSLTAA